MAGLTRRTTIGVLLAAVLLLLGLWLVAVPLVGVIAGGTRTQGWPAFGTSSTQER